MTITEAMCHVCRNIQPVAVRKIRWMEKDGFELRCKRCHSDVAVIFYDTQLGVDGDE